MTALAIRKAKPEDLEKVAQITIDAFEGRTIHQLLEKRCGKLGQKSWQERKAAEVIDFFERQPDNMLVSELDGEVVGFITFEIDEERKIGTVGNNAVEPKHQGKGIGTEQLRKALDIFKETGLKYALVQTSLEEGFASARRMYEKLGFEPLMRFITYFRRL